MACDGSCGPPMQYQEHGGVLIGLLTIGCCSEMFVGAVVTMSVSVRAVDCKHCVHIVVQCSVNCHLIVFVCYLLPLLCAVSAVH